MTVPRPLLLCILDGWGQSPPGPWNAISLARTPVLDGLMSDYPWVTLGAGGEDVGLPPGQMGNSEVGHLNIGAGRTVLQDYMRINHSIAAGDFYRSDILNRALQRTAEHRGTLHLMGLLSDGGVHSHIKHLYALIDMAYDAGLRKVCTHAFLDGRDVPPRSAGKFVLELEDKAADCGLGGIRTIEGRYYAMDRDNRWDRTALAYNAIVRGEGRRSDFALQAVERSYDEDVDDEFLVPTVIGDPLPMKNEDSVIFFNFRPDRPRQLARALVDPDFDEFDRGPELVIPYLVTMTEYDDRLGVPTVFRPELVKNTLADVLAANGKKQLHIAETEKYAHVTYFFNGGVEESRRGEDRVLIPSPKVATYDLEPEMSAPAVAEETVRRIAGGAYDFIVLNFANGDMVGHSGIMDAAVAAVETVDRCVGEVFGELLRSGGAGFITGDHGNADQMKEDGHACTAHSCSPVPFINVTPDRRPLRDGGTLGDIAPTILEEMKLDQPPEMTGTSLFVPIANGAG